MNNLRRIRLRKGWKLKQVAALMGVGFSTVQRWETGSRVLSLPIVERLARALGVSPSEIAGWTNNSCFRPVYRKKYTLDHYP